MLLSVGWCGCSQRCADVFCAQRFVKELFVENNVEIVTTKNVFRANQPENIGSQLQYGTNTLAPNKLSSVFSFYLTLTSE